MNGTVGNEAREKHMRRGKNMRKEFKNQKNQKAKIRIVEMVLAILLASCLLYGCSDNAPVGSKELTQSTDETGQRAASTKEGQEGKENAWEKDELVI